MTDNYIISWALIKEEMKTGPFAISAFASTLHKPYIAGSCCCDILANSRFIKGRS